MSAVRYRGLPAIRSLDRCATDQSAQRIAHNIGERQSSCQHFNTQSLEIAQGFLLKPSLPKRCQRDSVTTLLQPTEHVVWTSPYGRGSVRDDKQNIQSGYAS